MIEHIKASLEAQARGSVRVIQGTIEPAAATAPPALKKPKNRLMLEADTAVGPRERKPRKVPRLQAPSNITMLAATRRFGSADRQDLVTCRIVRYAGR